jgi:hypothetical protein
MCGQSHPAPRSEPWPVDAISHTHVSLDKITEAYKVFGERRDGVKVAIKP